MKRYFLIGLQFFTILILCIPVSFFITIVLYPFWLWIERSFNIEAAGHSGPSEWCFLMVYGICIILSVVGVFQFGSKIILSVLAATFGLIVLVLLFFPLPHGGSLGLALLHETAEVVKELPERHRETEKLKAESALKRNELHQKLSTRFAGPLDFKRDFNRDHWHVGTVLGKRAWLDNNTGIIWGSGIYTGLPDWGDEGLKIAIETCKNIEPNGFWSLPTNAEFALGIKSKMQYYIDDLTGKWIAQLYSSSLTGLNPMPSLVGFSNQGIQEISVRCVGRTSKAPLHGYIRDDISNADVMGMINR